MRAFRLTCTFAIICVLILILTACGGGGSDDEFVGPPEPLQKLNLSCSSSPQPCNS